MFRRIATMLGLAAATANAASPAATLSSTAPATRPAIVSLTPAAAAELQEIVRTQELKDWHLYIAVEPGGPSGFRYMLDIRDEPTKPGDAVYIDRGVRVSVDRTSAKYLGGVEVDFIQNDAGKGFVFRNPNVKPR